MTSRHSNSTDVRPWSACKDWAARRASLGPVLRNVPDAPGLFGQLRARCPRTNERATPVPTAPTTTATGIVQEGLTRNSIGTPKHVWPGQRGLVIHSRWLASQRQRRDVATSTSPAAADPRTFVTVS